MGCIKAHGGFALDDGSLFVATGTNVIKQVGADGSELGALDTRLENTHLTEFVVDHQAERLYAVAPCESVGGFSAVDLRRAGTLTTPTTPGEPSWDVPPGSTVLRTLGPEPCGGRLALGPAPLLVVAKTRLPVPQPWPGAVLVVDVRIGEVVREVATPSEPVDVLVIGR